MSLRPGSCLPLLITLLAAGGCQPPSEGPAAVDIPDGDGQGEVALRFVGVNDAALVVPVSINGEGPYDFILDTGATMTCVTARLAERLDLPAHAGAIGVGAGIGGSGQVRIVRVDSVAVGEVVASEMSACVLDLDHIAQLGVEVDGLLGLNFLRSFEVTLDFGRDVLRLAAPR